MDKKKSNYIYFFKFYEVVKILNYADSKKQNNGLSFL